MPEEVFLAPGASASLVAGANITLSSGSGNVTIIGGVNAGATTFMAGVSTDGNTAGTTGTVNNLVEFVGGTNVTLSQSKNAQSATISIIGPVDHQSIGMSNLGNTAGTTGVATGSNFAFFLAGGTNISLSQSVNGASATVSIYAADDVDPGPGENIQPVASANAIGTQTQFYAIVDHKHRGVFSIGVSTGGNTIGNTTILPGQMVLVGGSNITLSQATDATNGMTVTIMGPAESTLQQWVPLDYGGASTMQQIGQSTLKVFPGILEGPGSFSLIDAYGSVSQVTNGPGNAQFSGSMSIQIGLYTKNASSLSLATSGSQSFSWAANSGASLASYTGLRHFTVPIGLSMPSGNYWIGFLSMTTFSSKDNCSISNFGALIAPAWVNDFGTAQNATHQFMPGLGHYSVQTAALPGSMGFSELVGSASSTMVPYLDFLNFNFT